jgi:glycosyltransferase involved in cell wall biosynthesis
VTQADFISAFDRTAVIIPALNEARNLEVLLPELRRYNLAQILVCDNGSTDDTPQVVETLGAACVFEPRRGYGSACFAGMRRLAREIEIVVFIDADLSDDPRRLPDLVAAIARNECDLVIGARVRELREPQAAGFAQRFANRLFPILMRIGWGHRYRDMGPFRAIRRESLEAMNMRDRAYGWNIEMQIRAVEMGIRIREIPVPHRRREFGKSHISGNVRGVARAAYWITRTCVTMWMTKRRRFARGEVPMRDCTSRVS